MVLLALLVSAVIPVSVMAQVLTVSTDKATYLPSEIVTISGVADANAWVAVDVKNPQATSIFMDTVQANAQGAYSTAFGFPVNAVEGTYTVYVSAPGATASTTFIVSDEAVDTGTLSISTTPVNGEVFVDGISWGTAPVSQVVAVGVHAVSYGAKAGYTTPSSVSATVIKDTVTTKTGTYVIRTIGEGFTIDYVSEDTVDYGDELNVIGSGVTAGADVSVYWDLLTSDGLLNTTEGNPNGSFDLTIDIPSDLAGNHYLWARDESTGKTTMYGPITMVPRIKLSPSSGLYKDKVTIKGYGFSEEEEVTVTLDFGLGADNPKTSPLIPETDNLGYWTATFKVPDVDYGDFTVSAIDDEDESTSKDFTVGASITLDVEEGPTGTVVEISGEGFTDDVEIVTGMITLDGIEVYVSEEDTVDDGKFTVEVVIPSVSKLDEYEITVDDGTEEVSADFEVLGLAEIEIDPEFGVQGTSVQIQGYNFTAISGEDVSVELWDDDGLIAEIKEFETDSDGEFNGKFTIPARSSGVYTIKAIQEDYTISGGENFRIGLMIVILTPDSGPTGTFVTITGTGFTEGENWNATLGNNDIVEGNDGEVDSNSNLKLDGLIPSFYVPTVSTGMYIVTVMDIETEILVETEFTVTESTIVEFDPVGAPSGFNVSITGKYFAAIEGGSIEFELYNVTADGKVDEDWEMDVIQAIDGEDETVVVDEDGNFTAWWDFNDDDLELSVGSYLINITDSEDLFVQVEFDVITKTSDIDSRKTSFKIGETVAFNVESSFAQDESYIKVWEPSGALYWRTDDFVDWVKVGTIQRILYADQVAGGNPMMLLDDAPLGTWTWTWYDEDADELDDGVFAVEAAAADVVAGLVEGLTTDIDSLVDEIAALADDIVDYSDEFDSVKDNIAAVAALAADAVAAAEAAADAVTSVASVAGEAATAAADAADAANAAKDAADGLTTLVYGAIGASLVAALAAIVSLMQISKRIAG